MLSDGCCSISDDCLELKESVEKETGFALTFESVHKWIAFIHSKQNDILPVPNRYFGVYEDGTLKIRGIEDMTHLCSFPSFNRKF
jgi:DNA polymerase-2